MAGAFSAGQDPKLRELEQLLTVTVVQRDQNRQPLHDENGLAIQARTSGWRLDEDTSDGYRWTHAGLRRYLAIHPAQRPDLRIALGSNDPAVAATASIGLARLEGPRHLSALRALVRPFAVETETGPQLRTHDMTVRRAAIDTLASFPAPAASPVIDELLLAYGVYESDNPDSAYSGELHAELLYALARMVPAGSDPRFMAALESPVDDVKAAAVECLLADTQSALPRQIAELIVDVRSPLRMTAIRACGRRGDPAALPQLLSAAYDADLGVRLTAIAAIGQIGGDEAVDALRRLLVEGKSRIQESAVSALAAAGDYDAVIQAAYHEDWRVRRAAAHGLAGAGGDRALGAAASLLRDRSGDVQVQTVAAIDLWPLERAGPLLLAASDAPHPPTRWAAFRALARRWPPAAEQQTAFEFPPTGTPGGVKTIAARQAEDAQRRELLARLENRWRAEFGGEPVLADVGAAEQRVGEKLASYSLEPGSQLDGALAALRSPNPGQRQSALQRIARMAQQGRLPDEVLRELAHMAGHEVDPANWLLMLEAAATVHSEPSAHIARAALRQPLAEVRIAACRLLGAQPSPEHAQQLVAQLDEERPAVAFAALEALGGCGPLEDTMPIELMLASPNHFLRVDAAAALVRLGIPAGSDALLRLAHDPDKRVCVRAVNTMGGLKDPLFLHALIVLLDDRFDVSVRRAALAALPQVVGQDVAADIHGDGREAGRSIGDQSLQWRLHRWRQWYASGGRS